jgi:hypothetical protein
MQTVEPSCSRRGVDDVYWLFWRSPGAEGGDFSQNLNDREQPLALSNRWFKQSLYADSRAFLQQAWCGRRVLAVLEVPGC